MLASDGAVADFVDRGGIQKIFWDELHYKESLLKQKSRMRWAEDGDANSRYFHASLKGRRRRNQMVTIEKGDEWLQGVDCIKNEVKQHFEKTFSEEWLNRPFLSGVDFNVLNDEDSALFLEPFGEEEVMEVIWSSDGNKTPGPDGFNFNFLKAKASAERGKELANKKDQIKKLIESGKELAIELPARLPDVERYSSQHYIPFKSKESKYKELLDALKDDNNYMMGLKGMGVTGKTTLAKEVDDIAGPLGLKWDDCSESDRPKEIWSRLTNGEKILLILDDVWGDIDFDETEIPYSDNHKGCRVLVTTCKMLVCNKMGCSKIIQLKLLSKDDAWVMFKSLKGEQRHEEWNVALKSLQKHVSMHGEDLFVEDYGNYEDARSQVSKSKNKLLDSCLLLEADQRRVKMHDLVRDAAQWNNPFEVIERCSSLEELYFTDDSLSNYVSVINNDKVFLSETETTLRYCMQEAKVLKVRKTEEGWRNLIPEIVPMDQDERKREESGGEIVDEDNANTSHGSMFQKLEVLKIKKCPEVELILPFVSAHDLLTLESITIDIWP
ncbi:hypothetical protein TSUD_131080 [Trifolium subterraneum]|uniref:NB-ARC domain-containing protein n=1 Tax=Trifolium subterraneum TaxID=3900 RepID=A0A2Z6P0C8_TRISU|nr:hypothetical protein TSUD_131080 [Trifolium subterraneum]